MGCQKVFFVDGAHLSDPYQGILLPSTALDIDDHLFDDDLLVSEMIKSNESQLFIGYWMNSRAS